MQFFLGLILIILGFKVIIIKKFSARGGYVDFTNPYVHWSLGILLFYIAYLLIRYNPKEKQEKYTKCPKCKEVFNYKELKEDKCKYCEDIETIEIEEYYKKYSNENDK